VPAERHLGMNLFQLLALDWRIRLLAQATCAPYRVGGPAPKRPEVSDDDRDPR